MQPRSSPKTEVVQLGNEGKVGLESELVEDGGSSPRAQKVLLGLLLPKGGLVSAEPAAGACLCLQPPAVAARASTPPSQISPLRSLPGMEPHSLAARPCFAPSPGGLSCSCQRPPPSLLSAMRHLQRRRDGQQAASPHQEWVNLYACKAQACTKTHVCIG